MAKTIKVVTLMSQQLLISEIVEVAAVVPGEPDCKLINPFIIRKKRESVKTLSSSQFLHLQCLAVFQIL